MIEKSIEEIINEELSSDDKIVALDFITFLRENELDFVRDRGYWRDKIYFLVQYDNECVCFISIKDPDEIENRWTVWSDDMSSTYLADNDIENALKITAWEHVDLCGHCGSCGGGRKKNIFGKEFDEVCGCTFRFDNPQRNDLKFMKKMVEIRKRELLERNGGL